MLQPNAASQVGTRPSGPLCSDAALRGRWGGSPWSSRVSLGCAARVLQGPGPSVVGPSGAPPEQKAQSVKEGCTCYTLELSARGRGEPKAGAARLRGGAGRQTERRVPSRPRLQGTGREGKAGSPGARQSG